MTETTTAEPRWAWPAAVIGLAAVVFAVVALSGPGRIDIEDGQLRFEAGRSLVTHGDTAIRDPRAVWHRFPGRDGLIHTYYRFPGEVIAAACVLLADATGPATESREQVFYSFHGATIAVALAVAFAIWFRRRGFGVGTAIAWAAGGVFCTPCWYYTTSTFDDALGAAVVVAAVVLSAVARETGGWRLMAAAACAGLALNCKQPLGSVLFPCLAFADDPSRSWVTRAGRATVLMFGVVLGYAAYIGYEEWKFPPETRATHAAIRAELYVSVFADDPSEALLDYAAGPSSGAIWYCPPLLLCGAGLTAWWRNGRRREVAAVLLAVAVAVGFFSMLTFYKGGACWGPRYLTPLFALVWLFAPDGVGVLGPRLTRSCLAAGLIVQVLALSTVPERLYVERHVYTGFFRENPWLYFRPEISHILHRPLEVIDALAAPPAPEFTPGPSPTYTMPVFDPPEYTGPKGIEGVRRYTLLNELRPWWATYPHLAREERPADPAILGLLLGGVLVAGLGLLAFALCVWTQEGS
jgi:hypothetical protein